MRPIVPFRAAFLVLAMALGAGIPSAHAADDTPPEAEAEPSTVADLWAEDPARIFDATEVDPSDLMWLLRPVVVFANSPRDPAFIEQMEELAARPGDLVDRDVIVITDTDPDSGSALRARLRPRGFMMVLIGKDGQIALRKPLPWSVREIARSIDKMPMRRQELRERE